MPRENELGALWGPKKSKNGLAYMTGTINQVKVVCFLNTDKDRTNPEDKSPDWRVMKSVPRE